ncbi:MAG: hydroxymethylglutaryl-CoA lyase [Pseudomonadota bacterium]
MSAVEIFEVGPRDGLQNETRQIPTADKVALIDCLSTAGFRRIEAASFISPRWVPQMADSDEVMARITRVPGVRYAALTPNMRGFERSQRAEADEVAVFASASEGFSQANLNCSISESLSRYRDILWAASVQDVQVRGYISCVTDCPFDGKTPPEKVAEIADALYDMGCYEISLGDTLGHGTPDTVSAMLNAVLQAVPAANLAGHFHDTLGHALRNIDGSLDAGLRVFDAAVGGLGGCPYAPGATGNVATESVHEHLVKAGWTTGLDPVILREAAAMARAMRGVERDAG